MLVENIGVTFLFLTDTSLFAQSVVSPDDRIQVAEWDLDSATLDVAGALVDLSFGEPCTLADTAFSLPAAGGPCSSGVTIESSSQPYATQLILSFTRMQMRRAEPVELPENEDYDVDDVSNGEDNCPLVYNPDQESDELPGIGDACVVLDPFLGWLRDSEADGVPDIIDNCVWIANPGQLDTTGALIPDGIGDACDEETATVNQGEAFTLILEAPLVQPSGGTTYLAVDFDNRETLDCDWVAGTCVLDPDAVTYCTYDNLGAAQLGCP
jgi:hypothetical protein